MTFKIMGAKRAQRAEAARLHTNRAYVTVVVTVPRIIIKTGFSTADGREEELDEYMCDTPGCANVAVHVLGAIKELGVFSTVCQQHLPIKRQ